MYAEDLEPELARLQPDLVIHGWGYRGRRSPRIAPAFLASGTALAACSLKGSVWSCPRGTSGSRTAPHRHLSAVLAGQGVVATQDRIELRPVPYSAPAARPAWVSRRTARPLIYLTLGTAFGTPCRCGGAPWRQRHHPRRAYVGAPQLVLAQGADQFANADAVSAAGAGLLLLPDDLSANAIAEDTHTLLPHHRHVGHRDAARAIGWDWHSAAEGTPGSPWAVAGRRGPLALAGRRRAGRRRPGAAGPAQLA